MGGCSGFIPCLMCFYLSYFACSVSKLLMSWGFTCGFYWVDDVYLCSWFYLHVVFKECSVFFS